MPPDDASNRNRDAWDRLRQYVEATNTAESSRARPGLANCKRTAAAPASTSYDDDDDGPITTRWAVG